MFIWGHWLAGCLSVIQPWGSSAFCGSVDKVRTIVFSLGPWKEGQTEGTNPPLHQSERRSLCNPEILPFLVQLLMRSQGRTCGVFCCLCVSMCMSMCVCVCVCTAGVYFHSHRGEEKWTNSTTVICFHQTHQTKHVYLQYCNVKLARYWDLIEFKRSQVKAQS